MNADKGIASRTRSVPPRISIAFEPESQWGFKAIYEGQPAQVTPAVARQRSCRRQRCTLYLITLKRGGYMSRKHN